MLAVQLPPDTKPMARGFLAGWSQCMAAMMWMNEEEKAQVKRIFDEHITPQAMCQELKALDEALITYLTHKCEAPERVGSHASKRDG